jgi:fibrillarin-like pre-rRNA processing protein
MRLICPNVYTQDGRIYTRSQLAKSTTGERIVNRDGAYYHEWDPYTSKIAAALMRKLNHLSIEEDSCVLYLGCGSGTTVSHISDIAMRGIVFAVDISETQMRLLLLKLKNRMNVAPILADAHDPEGYRKNLASLDADVIIQDVAAKDQLDIFERNAHAFLKSGGEAYLSLKTKSISATLPPTQILEETKERLCSEFTILKSVNLRGYEDRHWLIHMRKA